MVPSTHSGRRSSQDEPSSPDLRVIASASAYTAIPGGSGSSTPDAATTQGPVATSNGLKPSPSRLLTRRISFFSVPRPRPRRRLLVVLVALIALALGLGLGLGLGLRRRGVAGELDTSGPVVHLGYASYRGDHLANGVSQFRGLRYAQPPLGDLRWRAPLAPDNDTLPANDEGVNDGIQQAKRFAPICLGISEGATDNRDEDCLFANVWAPANATAGARLPVVVFIQGGGYTRNANANWNGTRLVDTSGKGIVFVNFNYRVGLWGFLAGEAVRQDGDLNVGLLDQRRLLLWVQEHIHHFGGNPDHVVIQGVSAGAGSAALHLIANGGRNDNLFVGAISESTFIPTHPPVSELEYQFDRTVEQAGCADADASDGGPMTCLRGMSRDDLQALNVPGPFPDRDNHPLFYWTPCVDGDLLRDSPSALFSSGDFFKVPLLFGTCTDEGTVFARDASSPDELATFLLDNYPSLTRSHTSSILDLYPRDPDHDTVVRNPYFAAAARAYGEATFVCPTNNILAHLASNATWSYRYDVQQTDTVADGFGVPHVAEVPAVMGPDMLSYPAHPSYTTYNADAVPRVMNYWLSFVKSLNPNPHRLRASLEWEPWAKNQSRIVIRSQDSVMENVSLAERERCQFWQKIGPQINQ